MASSSRFLAIMRADFTRTNPCLIHRSSFRRSLTSRRIAPHAGVCAPALATVAQSYGLSSWNIQRKQAFRGLQDIRAHEVIFSPSVGVPRTRLGGQCPILQVCRTKLTNL